jgi:hypothetical protein
MDDGASKSAVAYCVAMIWNNVFFLQELKKCEIKVTLDTVTGLH